jgi:multidrug resistance efflux pump
VAEAVIEPAEWNEVAFASGGTVAEVLVEEGDVIEEGQLLARLDAVQQEAAVAQAEAGLRRAQARVDELKAGPRPQEIEAAKAAIEGAQAQLDRILQGVKPEEVAAAEASLGVAKASLQKVLEGASEQSLIAARADLANAEAQLQQAQAAYDRVKSEKDITARPESLALQQATHAYEAAKARLNDLKKGATSADVAIARAQVKQAQAQIDALEAPAQSADIAAAQAEIRRAEAQLALLEAGVRPETIAAAEADVTAAQAALDQAETALADMEMHALLAGTVTDVQIEVGDQVGPGQTLVVIAALDQFYVRTIDLVELDVARVNVGQPVVVTVDAFPEREFEGGVHEIALQAKDYRGDVVYDVTVKLSDPELSEALRWGMTAMVKIQTE